MKGACALQRLLAIVAGLLLFGCGYTNQAILPEGVRTIAVPTFKNELPQNTTFTYEAGLEIDVTNAVIDRLNYDGNLKVVPPEEADAVLVGTLTSYQQEALRYQDRSDIKEYRLFIGIDLEFINNKTNQVLWTEKGFTGRTEFLRTGSAAISEREAAISAREDLAKKIVDRLVEGW